MLLSRHKTTDQGRLIGCLAKGFLKEECTLSSKNILCRNLMKMAFIFRRLLLSLFSLWETSLPPPKLFNLNLFSPKNRLSLFSASNYRQGRSQEFRTWWSEEEKSCFQAILEAKKPGGRCKKDKPENPRKERARNQFQTEVKSVGHKKKFLLFGLSLTHFFRGQLMKWLLSYLVNKSAKPPKSAMSSVRRNRAGWSWTIDYWGGKVKPWDWASCSY